MRQLGQCITVEPSSDSSHDSQKSHAIPSSIIKEDWQLILDQNASCDDLKTAIEKCKELILQTEELSYDRKWFVRHLCELRLKLREKIDVEQNPSLMSENTKVILGHHFMPKYSKDTSSSTKLVYCDCCTGIIWNIIQASYICVDCSYVVHFKCVDYVTRVCANIIASEKVVPEENICPIVGMHLQKYKCIECQSSFHLSGRDKGYTQDARLCEYIGAYYCSCCHWNNYSVIPARIMHNWDFKLYKVSRASLQEINLFYDRAVVKLEEKNPKLFILIQKLSYTKKLRNDLFYMKKYLIECRFASMEKLLDTHLGIKQHLVFYPDIYSIADLVEVNNGSLLEKLQKLRLVLEQHIRQCEVCLEIKKFL